VGGWGVEGADLSGPGKLTRALHITRAQDGADLTGEGLHFLALAKFESFRPDLVTLDVMMPGMDGIEVLRRIREKNPSVPVLLLTAFGEFKQDFSTWASDAYIVKSADVTELKQTVRRLLGSK
jgi:DNA-binding response OmpR family regulator